MSADTTMAIVKINDKWGCCMIQCAEDFDWSFIATRDWELFDTKEKCLNVAFEICRDEYAEYGVCDLGEFTIKKHEN